MAVSARTLALRFLEGDYDCHTRDVTAFWVVNTVRNDPLRAVQVMRYLLEGRNSYAASKFEILLEQAIQNPEELFWHMVVKKRKRLPLGSLSEAV